MDCRTVEEAVVRLMTGVMETLRRIKPDVMIEFRQSYIGPAMRLYGNMFRVGDCPDDLLSNRVGMVDLRLLMGQSAVHSDMLMWNQQESGENAAVQIYQNNVLIRELPLDTDMEFEVFGEYTNTVRILDGKACMLSSDCPGGDCVHSGWISTPGRSIVCLPNSLEIRITGQSDVDFVVG